MINKMLKNKWYQARNGDVQFNTCAKEAEAVGSLSLRPAWSIEFRNKQGYAEKLCLRKKKRKKEGKRK